MEKFIVNGPCKLEGEIKISGAKNAAVAVLPATFQDVELFAKHVAPHVKIKAAGGISSLEDAETFISLGASRLGTSRIVKLAKAMEEKTAAPSDGSY